MHGQPRGSLFRGRSAEKIKAQIMAHDAGQKLGLCVRSILRMLAELKAGWLDRRPRGNPERTDAGQLVKNLSDVTTQPGSVSRAEMAALYAEKTAIDTTHMPFYLSFARFKLAVIVQQIYYRYSQGLTRDPRFTTLPDRVSGLLEASLHCAQSQQI